jgi:iron complex transport system ATP-binding protein
MQPGELVALIGPNGAGKTTLLRAGLGLLALDGGSVRLDGADPRTMAAPDRARRIAYLPQSRPLAWPLKVASVVALGRFAHGAPLQTLKGEDAAAVAEALAACRLEGLAHRGTDTLSGGELARVHVARALAARAPLLFADEPTAALDPLHAFETMTILQAFCARGGGALVTLHDLSLAARFADRIVLLHEGRVLAGGPPADVLTPALLAEAYGVRAAIDGGHVRIEGPA